MINWNNIKEGYDWFAVDKNGQAFAFKDKPHMRDVYWGEMGEGTLKISDMYQCSDWKESLIQRPVAVAESKGSNGFSVDQIKGFFETLTAQGAVGYNLDADDLMDMLNEHVAQEYNKQQDAITLLRKSGYIVTKETE